MAGVGRVARVSLPTACPSVALESMMTSLGVIQTHTPSVHRDQEDFSSVRGRGKVGTGGTAALRRGLRPSENAGIDVKMPFRHRLVIVP